MDEISTNIKDRILKIADIKQLNKDKFIESLNQKYSNYRGLSKKSSPSADVIAEISTKHPDINIEWVLTGQGEMLRPSALQEAARNYQKSTKEVEFAVPLISITAMAIFENNLGQTPMPSGMEKYVIPEFKESNIEFLVRMKGDSMQPKYYSGDLLGCRRLPIDAFFQWNRVYVLDTTQGPLIQRVQQSTNPGYLTCVSDNEAYQTFELNFETDVKALAIVLGAIRLE
ncbi:hypothetical protein M8998_15335 [Sphingobacterium sp. lm-10]|uniref:S24 family peptidase n=1 Tax=Sphingobacterium sp. lm-10 TaxID=2944904 RepID=UPI0020227352|nr:S24 family peptidase [Sphingobacterium sp. lm-10]MCL7989323.1 hypothetical protein [Sphingobacterium sp. lm-10]